MYVYDFCDTFYGGKKWKMKNVSAYAPKWMNSQSKFNPIRTACQLVKMHVIPFIEPIRYAVGIPQKEEWNVLKEAVSGY